MSFSHVGRGVGSLRVAVRSGSVLATALLAVSVLVTTASAQPGSVNDDCVDALPLQMGFAAFENFTATTDGDDLAGFCDPGPEPDDQIYNDVWFCWTADFSGPARVAATVFGPGRMAVYPGCSCPPDATQIVGCDENLPTDFRVFVDFDVLVGEQYLIRVGSQLPGFPIDGLIEARLNVPPVTNVVCDASVPGEVTATWDLPVGYSYDAIEVRLNSSVVVSIGATETSFTYVLPPVGASYTEICVAGVLFGSGTSPFTCCSVGVPPAPFDDCAAAEFIPPGLGLGWPFFGPGTTDGSDLTGFCDPGPSPDDQIHNDIWLCWESDTTGLVTARLSLFMGPDLRAAVYDGCACPADPADVLACGESTAAMFGTELTFSAVTGNSYLIRIGTQDPASTGVPFDGFLEMISGVPAVSNLACDSTVPGEISMSWTLPTAVAFDSIEITENGALVATLAGSDTSYIHTYTTPFVGLLNMGVRGIVGSTPGNQAACTAAIGGPDNDTCATATLIVEELNPFDTSAAQDEADPFVACGSSPVAPGLLVVQDIWYRFEAIETENVTFSLCGSSFDTLLVVYEDDGTCLIDPTTGVVGCDDNGCVGGTGASELTVPVTAGDSYLIRIGGNLLFGGMLGGPGTLTVTGTIGGPPAGPMFRRSDANGDGAFDVSDPVFSLAALFTPGSPAPGCLDAADANDDGGVDVSDPVFMLAALFTPGSPPAPDPGSTDCGEDPTSDTLECDDYTTCP